MKYFIVVAHAEAQSFNLALSNEAARKPVTRSASSISIRSNGIRSRIAETF